MRVYSTVQVNIHMRCGHGISKELNVQLILMRKHGTYSVFTTLTPLSFKPALAQSLGRNLQGQTPSKRYFILLRNYKVLNYSHLHVDNLTLKSPKTNSVKRLGMRYMQCYKWQLYTQLSLHFGRDQTNVFLLKARRRIQR